MLQKILIILIFLSICLIYSCREQAAAPDAVAYSYGFENIFNNDTIIKIDSTVKLIDSCHNDNYKAILEEYINLDSNVFKLTIIKDGINEIFNLNLPPGKTNISSCSDIYIVLSSTCGGPCFGNDFHFIKEKRKNEGYMFCHIADNNESIITHHENEEFELIKILNLSNSKEITEYIGPCQNDESYPCGIVKLKVVKNSLIITFDSPIDKPRIKTIDISKILK